MDAHRSLKAAPRRSIWPGRDMSLISDRGAAPSYSPIVEPRTVSGITASVQNNLGPPHLTESERAAAFAQRLCETLARLAGESWIGGRVIRDGSR
jgi:hypothetical protein